MADPGGPVPLPALPSAGPRGCRDMPETTEAAATMARLPSLRSEGQLARGPTSGKVGAAPGLPLPTGPTSPLSVTGKVKENARRPADRCGDPVASGLPVLSPN